MEDTSHRFALARAKRAVEGLNRDKKWKITKERIQAGLVIILLIIVIIKLLF